MNSPVQFPGGYTIDGRPASNYENRDFAFRQVAAARFDTFAQRAYVKADFLGEDWVPYSAQSLSRIRHAIVDLFRLDPGSTALAYIIREIAWQNAENPLANELRTLKWDSVPRVERFFCTHCSAEDTPLHRGYSRLFWRSLVGRALTPGCDVQYVFVLQGPQGLGKTLMLRLIAGRDEYFSDQDVIALASQQQQEALRGRWIAEAAELGDLQRATVEKVKAFVSRTHDRARQVWGTDTVDQPRSFLLVATTNSVEFLRDATGERRFAIIPVREIDLDAIARDRDQLLAEAVAINLADGSPLRLPETLWRLAEETQERFIDEDPLSETLASLNGVQMGSEERLPMSMVWEFLGINPLNRSRATKRRIIDALARLSWRYDGNAVMNVNGKSHRGFTRPIDEPLEPARDIINRRIAALRKSRRR